MPPDIQRLNTAWLSEPQSLRAPHESDTGCFMTQGMPIWSLYGFTRIAAPSLQHVNAAIREDQRHPSRSSSYQAASCCTVYTHPASSHPPFNAGVHRQQASTSHTPSLVELGLKWYATCGRELGPYGGSAVTYSDEELYSIHSTTGSDEWWRSAVVLDSETAAGNAPTTLPPDGSTTEAVNAEASSYCRGLSATVTVKVVNRVCGRDGEFGIRMVPGVNAKSPSSSRRSQPTTTKDFTAPCARYLVDHVLMRVYSASYPHTLYTPHIPHTHLGHTDYYIMPTLSPLAAHLPLLACCLWVTLREV
ncbi:hypothetical protein C8Q76DRAFT_692283 [Earliella scabrosa]|nr:hypothetical protein C8Q76DRAFT_692283 [Earliella scabrosa]